MYLKGNVLFNLSSNFCKMGYNRGYLFGKVSKYDGGTRAQSPSRLTTSKSFFKNEIMCAGS